MATAHDSTSSWKRTAGVLLALLAPAALQGFALPAAAAAAQASPAVLSPLPSSDYTVQPACAPARPGPVACQALELVPLDGEARAHRHPLGMPHAAPRSEPSPAEGDYGLTPADLHSAYALPSGAPEEQTIALVDAYNDPAAEEDLGAFDEAMGLPACTSANGCFTQVNQYGEETHLPFPATVAELSGARNGGRAEEAEEATEWGVEMSLDIETAHAICQSCRIVLAEASAPYGEDLEEAERSAEALGANEISNSWAGSEEGESEASEKNGPFDHPGTVITASAGDSGYLNWDSSAPGSVGFPASSPHVIAVGGTRLSVTRAGAWSGESVWNGDGAGGGGCSTVFTAPSWQLELPDWSAVGCAGKRAVADIAADADPYTGVAIEDSTSPNCEYSYSGHVQHWCTIGGTSLSSPLIAAVFALAGGSDGVDYPASTLYANAARTPATLHDISEGSNGSCSKPYSRTGVSGCISAEEAESCSSKAICLARAGYDGPTGLGTPDGIAAFQTQGAREAAQEEASPPKEEAPSEGSGEGGSGSGSGEEAAGEGSSNGSSGSSPGSEAGEGGEGGEGVEIELEEGPSGSSGAHARRAHRNATKGEQCVLSALSLAPASAVAARAGGARLSRIAYSFHASASSRVQVSVSRRLTVRGRTRWQDLARDARIEVARGREESALSLGAGLEPGTYRLTVKPARGRAASLVFEVR